MNGVYCLCVNIIGEFLSENSTEEQRVLLNRVLGQRVSAALSCSDATGKLRVEDLLRTLSIMKEHDIGDAREIGRFVMAHLVLKYAPKTHRFIRHQELENLAGIIWRMLFSGGNLTVSQDQNGIRYRLENFPIARSHEELFSDYLAGMLEKGHETQRVSVRCTGPGSFEALVPV